jgi:1L-myo-inositol 1-phosphate cytidylyltransferase / CDP-L-myo-inositol myo-inositolphosphotransferase
MKCVVLAAGLGSRLAPSGRPKPLMPVLGLPLLERTLATAAAAGLDDFCVVTGDALAVIASRRRLNIAIAHNGNWQTGNGASLLAASHLLDERFVLLVGDHVFKPALLAGLLGESLNNDSVIVAADFQLNRQTMIDPNDATKLLVRNQRLIEISKELRRYNAYDVGAFVCTPAVLSAVAASARDGDDSLAGGFQWLACRDAARAFDVGDQAWVDVDTLEGVRTAERVLLRSLTKAGDGVIARRLNRPVSTRVLTPALLRVYPSITPNEVSVLSLLVAIAAAATFLAAAPMLGGLLIALTSILDGSDGEIARLKYMQSPFGAYLDATLDRYADAIIISAMGIYAFHAATDAASWTTAWVLIAAITSIAALIGSQMRSYTSLRSIIDLGYRYEGRWTAAGRGRDVRLFTLSLGGVAAVVNPLAALMALGIVALVANGVVAVRLRKSWQAS